jgi:hypothetical protein
MYLFGPIGNISLFSFERLNSLSRKAIKGNNKEHYIKEIAKNSSIQESVINKQLRMKDIAELNHVLTPSSWKQFETFENSLKTFVSLFESKINCKINKIEYTNRVIINAESFSSKLFKPYLDHIDSFYLINSQEIIQIQQYLKLTSSSNFFYILDCLKFKNQKFFYKNNLKFYEFSKTLESKQNTIYLDIREIIGKLAIYNRGEKYTAVLSKEIVIDDLI